MAKAEGEQKNIKRSSIYRSGGLPGRVKGKPAPLVAGSE